MKCTNKSNNCAEKVAFISSTLPSPAFFISSLPAHTVKQPDCLKPQRSRACSDRLTLSELTRRAKVGIYCSPSRVTLYVNGSPSFVWKNKRRWLLRVRSDRWLTFLPGPTFLQIYGALVEEALHEKLGLHQIYSVQIWCKSAN